VDLTAEGAIQIGAQNQLGTGPDYAVAQRWSLALHDHPSAPDGILYHSRYDGSRRCLAVFDRARDALVVAGQLRFDAPPVMTSLVRHLLETYNFALHR